MTSGAHEILTRLEDARRQLEGIAHYDPVLDACVAGLARMEAVLARPPRVVILGEVNSGKTSVADLLLGVGLLPSSVVANTRLPLLIRYGETMALHAISDDGRRALSAEDDAELPADMRLQSLEISLPNERLQEFEIVDTPATSDLGSGDTAGDIRIWCTVATRAWTESERAHWSGLPRRNWRNAMLVATHKDALDDPGDATKIEWRLRAAAGHMFRDVILVSAADAVKSRRTNGRPSDASAIALLGQVRVWAREIRDRRAHKVETIARRLARLTFHQLARVPLRSGEARILKDWEADCARLLARLGSGTNDLADVMQQMLRRFAQAMELAQPGSIGGQAHRPAVPHGRTQRRLTRGVAARRFGRLIAADLTALLRIELARVGLRDASLFSDYAAAKAALLPLARLDLDLDELDALLAGSKLQAAIGVPPQDQERLLLADAT